MNIQLEDVKLAVLAIFKRKKLVVAVAVLGALIGVLAATLMPARLVYSSKASVYSATYGSYQEAMDGVTAMMNYSDVMASSKVCQRAASNLRNINATAKDIQNMISVSTNDNGYIIYVEATSDNPEVSSQVANAVAEAFVVEMSNITGKNAVQLLDEASVSDTYVYYSTSKKKVMGLCVIVSIAIICAYIVLSELFSGKVKCVEQCIEGNMDEVIGIIPTIDR